MHAEVCLCEHRLGLKPRTRSHHGCRWSQPVSLTNPWRLCVTTVTGRFASEVIYYAAVEYWEGQLWGAGRECTRSEKLSHRSASKGDKGRQDGCASLTTWLRPPTKAPPSVSSLVLSLHLDDRALKTFSLFVYGRAQRELINTETRSMTHLEVSKNLDERQTQDNMFLAGLTACKINTPCLLHLMINCPATQHLGKGPFWCV